MTVYYTLPDEQAEVLGWMVDGARLAPRHLHKWTLRPDGVLIGAGQRKQVLPEDVHALESAALVKVTARNYVYGNEYVLEERASDYIDKWRAQRLPAVEPTGWAAVDQAVSALRTRLGSASTSNDYKAVGHECVTVVEALGRAAFDPARHLPAGESAPSTNDAKRRLELFIRAVAPGERFSHVRKIINESYAQGHEIKHRTQPNRLDAAVSADAVLLTVSMVRRFADAETEVTGR